MRQVVRGARWRGARAASRTLRSPWWLLSRTAAQTLTGGGAEFWG
jgi:hypothetical protein